jgi:Polyketide cyclase / dehydrase and lipid transport
MATQLVNSTEIACTAEALYGYVTQPWRWHEWHPNSKRARASVEVLGVGDHFDEQIELQPLSPLPYTMTRETRYEVLRADPPRIWECRGEMRDGWLTIRYDLEPSSAGTRFTRMLTFETSGLSSLLVPFLRSRMADMSVVALGNLKRRMENGRRD